MTARRLEGVRQKLSESRLQALIVTYLPHVRYLTGFSGSHGICVITHEGQAFLSDGRYRDQAPQEVEEFRIIISSGNLFEAVSKKRLLTGKRRVGFESQHLTVSELKNLQGLFPRATFVPTSSLVEDIGSVKDEQEIDTIKEAVSISDKVFAGLLKVVNDGVRELDVAAEISYMHRKLGAEADAFEPIVASGVRGALPHARASDKKIQRGEMVTLDFGCRVKGYHSDLTRTIAVGNPPDEMKRIYAAVLDAQQKAIEGARTGIRAAALDSLARKQITAKGYGKNFNHSLGHGLGLQVHERPRVSKLSKEVLQTGNVITIEPGVYVAGVGGVRIEDDVVIRNGRCEVLNRSPKDLIVL